MKRKSLWKKISYITFSGVLAFTGPASSFCTISALAEDAAEMSAAETESMEAQSEHTSAEETPSTEPAVTEPQTEAPPTEEQTGGATEPQTEGMSEKPQEPSTETQTGETADSQTEEQTGQASTEGQTAGTETGSETESTEPGTAQTGDEVIVSDSDDIKAQAFPKKMVAPEDHSLNNENWKTNVIASNAAYLGQLANLYGLSFSDDFTGTCTQVEQEFAAMLEDPENFHATNWKDVIAVFLYEAKRRTGSGNISAASEPLLLEIFTEMNLPERQEQETVEVPEITEVFVDEYPIEEDLEQIDRQEELLLSANNSFGSMGALTDSYIADMADAKREAKRDEQKLQMDENRYGKWLRGKQEQERQEPQKEETITAAGLVPLTIDDYVKKHGIDSEGQAEIAGYASAECLQLMAIASAEPQIVRASVGNEVSEERVRIVTAAYRLVGKVGYFWGGKSYAIGWDSRWGSPQKVTAKGSTSTGMIRKYGLDCSGFTLYCYYNGLGGSDAGIGGHTTTQWNASVMVDQVNAQPGDLVFYGGPERGDTNHVGLVVGKATDGGLIVAHCSSSRNGVVVGEAWSSGFRYVRTVNALP